MEIKVMLKIRYLTAAVPALMLALAAGAGSEGGVFQLLQRADLDLQAGRLGGDLDLLAGARVAADAGLAVHQLDGAEAAERDLALGLQPLHHDFLDGREHGLGLHLRHTSGLGDRLEELGLRHVGKPS